MNKFFAAIRVFLDTANKYALKISMVMLMFSLALLTLHVFLRYAFSYSMEWTEEAGRFVMVWTTFLLLPLVQVRAQHITVAFAVARFKDTRIGAVLALLIEIAVLVVLAVCIYEGSRYFWRARLTVSSALQMPMAYVYAVLPYSFVMTFLASLERLYELTGCLRRPETLSQCTDFRQNGGDTL